MVQSKVIVNIFSFSEMEDKFPITYNSTKEKVFYIHMPNKVIKINREDGLYSCFPEYSKNPNNNKVKILKLHS